MGASTGSKSGPTCSGALCSPANGAASAPKAAGGSIRIPIPGAALNALAGIVRAKRRRGYRDRAA